MKTTDKFLIGIVAGIVLLIVIALVVALGKTEDTYLDQNTPESVVHDYLLALQSEDYPKAHSYLSSSIKGYPRTAGKFTADIDNMWDLQTISKNTFAIESAEITPKGDTAAVIVGVTNFRGVGLFNTRQYYSTFAVDLTLIKDQWKIEHSDRYFAWCWLDQGGCK